MYGGWTEYAVLWTIFFNFSTTYIYWVWAQSLGSKSWIWVGTFSESGFLKLLNNNDKKYNKLYTKLIWCLGTGSENKNKLLSSKISNLIQLSVFIIFLWSQRIFCRFSGIFIWKTTFEEFEEICEQIHRK